MNARETLQAHWEPQVYLEESKRASKRARSIWQDRDRDGMIY